jgi:hypothetical protein
MIIGAKSASGLTGAIADSDGRSATKNALDGGNPLFTGRRCWRGNPSRGAQGAAWLL